MEKSNGSSTVKSIYEASGVGVSVTTASINTSQAGRLPIWRNAVEVKFEVKPSLSDVSGNNTTIATMVTNTEKKHMSGTTLLQTNVLLIAVLIVCFITLTSVIAICACMVRRYCKKQRISQSNEGQYQTVLVSKSTSITGLNTARQYYSTKVEKKDAFSKTIIAENRGDEAAASGLDSRRDLEYFSDIAQANLGSVNPSDQVLSSKQDIPIYFKMKNMLTSTPAASERHQNGEARSASNDFISTTSSPPLGHAEVPLQSAAPSSVYASALSNHKDGEENTQIFAQPDILNTGEKALPMRDLEKGYLTQSVTWFVPLNGNQREPLRHSIVESVPNEINVKDYEMSEEDQRKPKHWLKLKKQSNGESIPLFEMDEKETKLPNSPIAMTSETTGTNMNCETSTTVAEDAPLMGTQSSIGTLDPAPHSLPTRRSRLTSTMSEDKGYDDYVDSTQRTRSQSFSSDDNNMWKQREERPVLFLGSGMK